MDAISNALGKGRLVTIEEAVSAEVLGDLLEHAEELIKAKYHLAAAIILRAVLEERLRKLCESNNCMPTSQRPTIESFKQSLQAATVIDKIGVKDIDWMAGVGNAAQNTKMGTCRHFISESRRSYRASRWPNMAAIGESRWVRSEGRTVEAPFPHITRTREKGALAARMDDFRTCCHP